MKKMFCLNCKRRCEVSEDIKMVICGCGYQMIEEPQNQKLEVSK